LTSTIRNEKALDEASDETFTINRIIEAI